MAAKKALLVRSFAHSTRSAIVGYRIPIRFPLTGAFLQQRRSFFKSAPIDNASLLQRLNYLRWKPWNLEQKRFTSNSEEVDRKDPYFCLKDASMVGNIDPKHEEEVKKESSPLWTTPEQDPNKSMYVQHPIAEKDCKPLRLYIPTEECMEEIGAFVAMMTMTTPALDRFEVTPNKGDVIFLKGDLGAGKSVFARGFVRGALGNWDLDVPSPTYILSNTYFASEDKGSNQNFEIYHMDLYRLPEHASRQYFMLNLDYVFKNCISLVEWPERLPPECVPEERLEISIDFATEVKHDGSVDINSDQQYRIMKFHPIGSLWRRRVYDMRYMGYIEDLLMKEKDEFNPNEQQH